MALAAADTDQPQARPEKAQLEEGLLDAEIERVVWARRLRKLHAAA